MNKITKSLITIVVFTLVILYFVKACGKPRINTNIVCNKFNQVLNVRVQEYFQNDLPTDEGDVKTASISDLISVGLITLEDLNDIGTTCTGNVYVSNAGDKYYYYNEVNCGICDSNNMYTAWSDWTDTLPLGVNNNYQIQVKKLYNYGKDEVKYTEWSDWSADLKKIVEPALPNGVQLVDTEIDEKIQYSYRDGTFKWYKNNSAKTYYNGGAYYESQPSSGYVKDTTTKTYSNTQGPYQTTTALSSAMSNKVYDEVSVDAYKLKKYVYSKTTSSTACKTTAPYYKCYKNVTTTNSVPNISTSSATTLSQCQASYGTNAGCTTYTSTYGTQTCTCPNGGDLSGTKCYKSTTSGGTYYFEANFSLKFPSIEGRSDCTVECEELDDDYGDSWKSGVKRCLQCGRNCNLKYAKCGGADITWGSTTNPIETLMSNSIFYSVTSDYNNDGTTTTSSYTADCDSTPTYYGYRYNVINKEYASGSTYKSCPSTHPIAEATGSIYCAAYETLYNTVYLKADGSTTSSLSEAAYLTASQYKALGSKGTGFTKTSTSIYDSAFTKGSCPSGEECTTGTMYEAKVYKFKWYIPNTSGTIWYNDGGYLSKSPGSGWIADKTSARWGEWSEFSDTKATASDSREVKTQTIKRVRKSYISSSSLVFDEWLELQEFQNKVGKALEELKKDKNVKVQSKLMYKYRVLK